MAKSLKKNLTGVFKIYENNQVLSDGDSIELSLNNPILVLVTGYSEKVSVSSEGLELSLEGDNWSSSVTIDFSSIIEAELWIKPGSSDRGTVTVLNV
jgi:hypothetical protein